MHNGKHIISTLFHQSKYKFKSSIINFKVMGRTVSSAPSTTEWPFSEKSIQIKTLGELYSKWRDTEPGYEYAPKEGLTVTVPYIHTVFDRPESDSQGKRPLVLILPGAPGHYKDFKRLIPFLFENGVDVLSPVWPDMTFSYETQCYWHSSAEKTQLLRDFLKSVNVEKIDMLIAHSSAIFPGVNIISEPGSLNIKSLALVGPAGHEIVKSLEPVRLMKTLAEYYRYYRYQALIRAFLWVSKVVSRSPVRSSSHDALLSLQAMFFSERDKTSEQLKQLAEKKFPTLIAFSENDKLMTAAVIFRMANMMGAANSDIWYYDEDGKLTAEGKSDSWLKVLAFKKGTHFPFHRHADVVSPAILEHLKKVVNSKL